MPDLTPRTHTMAECSHMRPVVYVGALDGWHHVSNGRLTTYCSAGVYAVTAEFTGNHYIHELIKTDKENDDG